MKLPASVIFTTAILILGLITGWGAATYTPLPLPWMLAPLLITAIFVMVRTTAIPSGYQFPKRFRLIFIAIIGLMIGTQVTWDIVGNLPPFRARVLGVWSAGQMFGAILGTAKRFARVGFSPSGPHSWSLVCRTAV